MVGLSTQRGTWITEQVIRDGGPMNNDPVMRPGHPRWSEFISMLSHAVICLDTTENTRDVLNRMSGVDVDQSLTVLSGMGGVCDCRIVFEVAEASDRLGGYEL